MSVNYKTRLDQAFAKGVMAGKQYEQRFCFDMATAALGRMGYGEKRLKDFERVFSEVYNEYYDLLGEDGSTDKDTWYYRAALDRELKQYLGDALIPYDERYKVK